MSHGSENSGRTSLRPWIADWIGIDPRALAVFRIGLAATLLVDLLIRATDLTTFYTDESFFPFEAATRWHGTRWNWSLHLLEGSAWFQGSLLLLAAVLAVGMLLGYRTWLTTIGSWVLLASLHNRVPMLLNGGDVLFRLLLFWGMFLPLGRVWSLDALRRRRAGFVLENASDRYQPVVSAATVAVLLQLCLMYWFTGNFKYNSDWLSGESMYYVFSFDAYGRPLGRFLLEFPLLCKLITWGTLWLELIGPWLVMMPFPWLIRLADRPDFAARLPGWTLRLMRDLGRYTRPAIVLAFLGMHVGIELTMTVGLFSYVSVVGWMVFVPRFIWDGLSQRILPSRNRGVDKPETPTAAPQLSLMTAPTSDFIRRFCRKSGGISHGVICATLLLYVVWWNVATLRKSGDFNKVLPKPYDKPAGLLLVGQKWSMFSSPTKDDGWFVAQAVTANGRKIDILRGGAAVDPAKPADVAGIFPNHRWRKFYRQLLPDNYEKYRAAVAEHLGRTWNRSHNTSEQVVSVELLYFRERTVLDPEKISVERVELVHVELAPPTSDESAPDDAGEVAISPQREIPR